MAPTQKILIVGGGSTGWMKAAYLNKVLDRKNKRVEITLIESTEIVTVGIGEATIPTIQQFFTYLGLKEDIWMQACNATYKLAIKFEGWLNNGPPDHYWQIFGNSRPNNGGGFNLMHHWLHSWKTSKTDVPFTNAIHEVDYLCEAHNQNLIMRSSLNTITQEKKRLT